MNENKMMDNLRLKILENGLCAGLENFAEFQYSEISGFTCEDFQIFIDKLGYQNSNEKWRIMEIVRYYKPTEGFSFILTDKGFIEAENDLNGPITSQIIKILQYLDELGRPKILMVDLIQKIKNKFTQIDTEKIIARMKWTLTFSVPFEFTDLDERIPTVSPFNSISDNGRSILKDYYHSKDIFNHTPHKEELLKEHHMIDELRQIGEFKDAIVKIGSVIEYVVSEWLKRNSHSNPQNFHKKLIILEKLSVSNQTGSISPIDWGITKQIIKEYRNFIHLNLYFDSGILLSETEFRKLEPVYEKILHELS